jgi:hypothetical protein
MTTNVGHGRASRQGHLTQESQWPRHIGRKPLMIVEVAPVELPGCHDHDQVAGGERGLCGLG